MVAEFNKVLDEFKKLSPISVRDPTFLEIAGYPQRENVCSNLLAFFFDPNRPHGLGPLFIDALLGEPSAPPLSGVTVEREVAAGNGRIDILIYSETHVIAIENKIFHDSDNPWEEYAEYVSRRAGGIRTEVKRLLTLRPPAKKPAGEFVVITYEEFFRRLRSSMGDYLSDADTRCLTLLLDFLNSIDRLQPEASAMTKDQLEFFSIHDDDIQRFLEGIKNFKNLLRTKTQTLGVSINFDPNKVERTYYAYTDHLKDSLVYDITHPEFKERVVVETVLSARAWEIQIFLRGRDQSKMNQLKALLQRQSISFEQPEKRLIYPTRFAYNESYEKLSSVLQVIIDKLSTAPQI